MSAEDHGAVSRRAILTGLAQVGGLGATFAAMRSLGYFDAEASVLPAMEPTLGRGTSVVILGAGIAGLTAAYELERAGFIVTLVEARDRIGGRNWTLRSGSRIQMVGVPDQICDFEPGVYANAGPGRIPSHHEHILGYCRQFGVAMEVEVNTNRSAWLVSDNGNRIQMRAAVNDLRGELSELLLKVMSAGQLDSALTRSEREKLAPFLKTYGDLQSDGRYRGSQRSVDARIGSDGREVEHGMPLSLKDMLSNEQLGQILFEEENSMQATMLQPVGGMDRIPQAFRAALKSKIITNAEVTSIILGEKSTSVTYVSDRSGNEALISADYVICTIPLTVLSKIKNNFSSDVRTAIRTFEYSPATKLAFQSPRFWERENIFGGLTFVGGETQIIWYPSGGLNTATQAGLVASYAQGTEALALASLSVADQLAKGRAAVERAHPGKSGLLSRGVAINWDRIRYSEGAWPHLVSDEDTPGYKRLQSPERNIVFAGGHLSHLGSWQEGAVLSAHRAVAQIAERTRGAAV